MKNKIYNISVDDVSGCVSKITLNDDENGMNWCSTGGLWGRIHNREMKLVSYDYDENGGESIYQNDKISVRFIRRFLENGNATH